MKIKVFDQTKKDVGSIELPSQFSEEIRSDLIKRAVIVIQSNTRQPYGANTEAGMRASAELSRRRHNFKGSYGYGISRVPRKIMSARGTRFNWVGALSPGTVGGRRAHPPKVSKDWSQKINTKERRKAIRSALAASMDPEIVKSRGHRVPEGYPFALNESWNDISKTKFLKQSLEKLGLSEELNRISDRKIRSGKGKMRGRRYVTKKGPLLIVSKESALLQASKNLLGVETIEVHSLNAELLAPGAVPGRLVLFTQSALATIDQEKLFTTNPKIKKVEKKKEVVPKKAKPQQPQKKTEEKKLPAKDNPVNKEPKKDMAVKKKEELIPKKKAE